VKRWAILIVLVALPVVWMARGAVTPGAPAASAQARPSAMRFVPVDVYVDTGSKHLGAYQFEVTVKDATIVGLEGSASPAFADANYDPAALQGDRIVVAAFSTDDVLPTGDTRVARLHFLATGSAGAGNLPAMTSKLVVATDELGRTIDAKLTLRAFDGQEGVKP
jgi:hypothetical protein